MAFFLVVRHRSGPSWDPAQGIEGQTRWPEHRSFVDALVESGFIVLGGPLVDDDRVVFAVEADSREAVHATLERDPWNGTHLLTETVEPWTIRRVGRPVLRLATESGPSAGSAHTGG